LLKIGKSGLRGKGLTFGVTRRQTLAEASLLIKQAFYL